MTCTKELPSQNQELCQDPFPYSEDWGSSLPRSISLVKDIMRKRCVSEITLLIAVIAATQVCIVKGTENAVKASRRNVNADISVLHRYLKGAKTPIIARAEERWSMSSAFKPLKSKLTKSLDYIRQKRMNLDAFFKENPVIKKEIIVATVLLLLIVSVPLSVKWMYPA
ncbi:hypothetical protein Plhal304r1_c009g0037291 [Plasmopara halstedii]